MPVRRKDRTLLRELGRHMAEIAAMPVQHETIRAWKTLNSLKPIRPMVMVGMSMDHIPWNEMEVDEELKLQAEDDFKQHGIE